MLRLLILILACLGATPLHAGAWPREKGKTFLSAATRVAATDMRGPFSVYSAGYLEYGLTDRFTIGLDIGHGISGKAKAVAFLRHPLALGGETHLFAVELGLGIIAGEPALRPGVSYGRGLSLGRASGWLSVETFAEYRLGSGRLDVKSDVTFGLNHPGRLTSIVQLQTGLSQGDPSFIRLAPSLVIRTGARNRVELGLSAGLVGDEQIGVKLGFWRDF